MYTRALPVRHCCSAPEFLIGKITPIYPDHVSQLTTCPRSGLPPRAQLVNTAVDFAWFAGSTALLVSLPILIELQRETTVLVLQRQREVETRMTFEQAKQMNPGIIDQAKGVLSMVTGRPLDAPPLPQ